MSTSTAAADRPLDLEQARRRAKELRDSQGTSLSQAQHQLAGQLGFSSWPALVRSLERFSETDLSAVPFDRLREVTIICLPVPGEVQLYRNGDRWDAPHDRLQPGEHPWHDAVLRIPLERMGFRRQGTHVFAIDDNRRHAVFWVDGDVYTGNRPHAHDVQTWQGPAAEAVELLTLQGDQALARLVAMAVEDQQTMDYQRHRHDLQFTLEKGYLAATSFAGGSGFGGDADDWRDARQGLTDVLVGLPESVRPESGETSPVTFLDVGCADGLLPASFVEWGAERGVTVEPFGLDLSAALVARAAERYPQWRDRFFVGDALDFDPGRRFDLVHLLLDVLPDRLHAQAIDHWLTVVSPGGRLLVSSYAISEAQSAETLVSRHGHRIDGRTSVRTRRSNGNSYGTPSIWITVPR